MAQVAIEAAQVPIEAARVPTETAPEPRFGDVTTEDVTDDVIDDVADGVRPHDYQRTGQAQEDTDTDTATDRMQDRMQEKEALECKEVQHSEASDVTPLDEDEALSSVSQEADPRGVKVEFSLEVHGLASDERVYLVGSDTALGCWEPKHALEMRRITDTSAASSPCGTWRCEVWLPLGETIKYKYMVLAGISGGQEPATWRWEPGRDRSMTAHADADKGCTKVEDIHSHTHKHTHTHTHTHTYTHKHTHTYI
jgi:hypothetical protein